MGSRDRHTGYGTPEREELYVQNVAADLRGAVRAFFEEAREEQSKYQLWKEELSDLFASNEAVTLSLVVEGHASPLSNPRYNLQLSKRRIHSIVKDMSQSHPVLAKALKDGRLVLPPVAMGDQEGREKGVSADAAKKGLSIFHPEAARQEGLHSDLERGEVTDGQRLHPVLH